MEHNSQPGTITHVKGDTNSATYRLIVTLKGTSTDCIVSILFTKNIT